MESMHGWNKVKGCREIKSIVQLIVIPNFILNGVSVN